MADIRCDNKSVFSLLHLISCFLFYNLICKLTDIYLLLFINQCMLVCSVFAVFMYIADTKSGLYQK